jgi:outer membrane lipoprotein SlyB
MLARMPRGFLTRYVLSLLLFHLAGCSTMQPVDIENAMQTANARGVDYGSLVEVRTLDRQSARFRVTDITGEGLGGNPGFYRYEDMKSLKVEGAGSGSGETWGYILGALGIVALVAIVASADSVAICSPSPCPEP